MSNRLLSTHILRIAMSQIARNVAVLGRVRITDRALGASALRETMCFKPTKVRIKIVVEWTLEDRRCTSGEH